MLVLELVVAKSLFAFCCIFAAGDVEFLSSLVWIVMTCLHSGGYSTLPSGASANDMLHFLEMDVDGFCASRIEKAPGSSH